MNLTEFLLARIAEDEEVARLEIGRRDVILTGAFAPHRILAECEAKRRIVELHRIGYDPCDAHDASFESIPCETLELLALPYADHPDYREAWRP
jgi:hypothetical protein